MNDQTQKPHPFKYVKPNETGIELIEQVRGACAMVYDLLQTLPVCRETSLAITKLEEVSMWANKGIAFNNPAAISGTEEEASDVR